MGVNQPPKRLGKLNPPKRLGKLLLHYSQWPIFACSESATYIQRYFNCLYSTLAGRSGAERSRHIYLSDAPAAIAGGRTAAPAAIAGGRTMGEIFGIYLLKNPNSIGFITPRA